MILEAKDIIKFHEKINKPFEVTVNGRSMQPVLFNGDVVTIKAETSYMVNDVVLFKYKTEGELIHRIIAIDDKLYSCKGDNAIRVEYVLSRHIIGKAVSVYRDGCDMLI